jgi:hypothetical protein
MINEKILLAGPWIGELGWELFCWQGFLRSIAYRYDKVIIISRRGHEILYKDFCNMFIGYNPPKGSSPMNFICDGVDIKAIEITANHIKHSEWIKPYNIGFTFNKYNIGADSFAYKNQKFINYKSNTLDKKYDIIIHPRNKKTGDFRNWDNKNWNYIIGRLKYDYSIALIGGHESLNIDGIDNYKNHSLSDVVSLFNRCKLVVGQVSGPIHLASLCSTQHLVWGDEKDEILNKKNWNPFNTPCYFIREDNYNPAPDKIYNNIIKIMEQNNE